MKELETKKNIVELVDEISHYLPSQGPVSTFVHHNTLHYFESLDFFEAIETASKIYEAKAYHSEKFYQEQYKNQRISKADINKAINDNLVDFKEDLFGIPPLKIVRHIILNANSSITKETLRWKLQEKGSLYDFSSLTKGKQKNKIKNDDVENFPQLKKQILDLFSNSDNKFLTQSIKTKEELSLLSSLEDKDQLKNKWKNYHSLKMLWLVSLDLAKSASFTIKYEKKSNESKFLSPSKEEISKVESTINSYLIKYTASFLDSGLAHLHVDSREKGFLFSFLKHLENDSWARPQWLHGDFSSYKNKSAENIIEEHLNQVEDLKTKEIEPYLLRKALILKGWGGLISQIEKKGGINSIKVNFIDFLAVRLILEEAAKRFFSNKNFKNLVISEQNNQTTDSNLEISKEAFAYHLFRTFQSLGISASNLLLKQNEVEVKKIVTAFDILDQKTRLRIWQSAYEWNLYSRLSSALIGKSKRETSNSKRPKADIVCCIDDREESFRRYVEEISKDYSTYGTAGFFGVDAEFHSLYEKPAAFCPVNITPTHKVKIIPKRGAEEKVTGFGKLKEVKSDLRVHLVNQSKTLFRGWLIAIGGILALVPLSISTLSPRWTHKFKGFLQRKLLNPGDDTSIIYSSEDENSSDSSLYTLEEMMLRVRALLTSTGMIKNLSPLVIIMGHGSFSSNNPYRSAYDCGACGGRPARLNPRVFAHMANRKDVREALAKQGFTIPSDSHFVGSFHNTCTDEVEYFDQDLIPDSHLKLFEKVKEDIEKARAKNALERCRRFDETHLENEREAILHVESRAYHIAQPIPEYGHATNAFCIVGKRDITKNLFLDRRAFLVSYDREIDPNQEILTALLRAVIPVCMGINLEYFFSCIDNQKYGAGTKLPHNVTSLLGLMTGFCSDLRTGLPSQMIEIHEAVRLLFVIEASPSEIKKTFEKEPYLGELAQKGWFNLFSFDSENNKIFQFKSGEFSEIKDIPTALGKANSSLEWTKGKTAHLEFIEIGA